MFLSDLLDQMPLIMTGLVETLKLTVTMSITGLIFGIVVFYLTLSHRAWVRRLIQGTSPFHRNASDRSVIPDVLRLTAMGISLSPFMVAVIGFTLNVAAYNAAYMTTAYNGLDYVEIEAGRAQGFNHTQVFGFIVLPQVLRLSVPALTNQVIRNLKDSSVAFLIQYTEFFARVQELAATNFQFFQAYLFAAIVYLLFVSILVLAARYVEKRVIIPGFSRQDS
ncbi:amino acid ABC transporter permease [Candidatus Reidiella endopervernicosa]|uniref:Amino acid ABC transporter permease n=1 Tax=Candidatus Reidiella endopervernicosa TaxID=2738883 RepID=A0A6N0HVS3_9GAMM|nr:amino acid ABC transporter permease [Candidatus Reidiella endopervernicosa]QKQ26450.1 amino acid ABC transporter permease [Candidatus Reidiella endopervernicosa]